MLVNLERLKELNKNSSQGIWEWWNGCSWWRLGTTDQGERPLIEPTNDRSDKHPNLIFRNHNDRELIVELRNALPFIIEELAQAREHRENCDSCFDGQPHDYGEYDDDCTMCGC